MPSPSQDSAEWKTNVPYSKGQRVTCLGEAFTCARDHVSDVFGTDLFDFNLWKGESPKRRCRTPSVPGEDMRARAATFLRDAGLLDPSSMHRYGLTERLATELSSTAALAREEAAKIADRWDLGNSETTTGGDLIARRIAAAIRAIGKEG